MLRPQRAWVADAIDTLPFILATLVKTLLAAAVMPMLWKILPRRDA